MDSIVQKGKDLRLGNHGQSELYLGMGGGVRSLTVAERTLLKRSSRNAPAISDRDLPVMTCTHPWYSQSCAFMNPEDFRIAC